MAIKKPDTDRRTQRLTIRLRPDERAALASCAEAQGLKLTEILRIAVREHLRAEGYTCGGDDVIPYKSRQKRQKA
ncbi:MAG: hypothetical protein Q4E18_03745 [Clostridia bacterium]|nr:hypothetical protein [Clostridia bacterium]